MSFDMRQFLQTFFEESFEGLDVMENGLLNLDVGRADSETINTIFRAAHSIKGGSATFGLGEVSAFTHGVETLLDGMRDGRRAVNQPSVDLLLRAVDCLRDMLRGARDGAAFDASKVVTLNHELEVALGKAAPAREAPLSTGATAASGAAPGQQGWWVEFKPLPHMLKTGNEPVRMFRELASLGKLTAQVDLAELPHLADLDSDEIFLKWNLALESEADEAAVREVFEWVDGDCALAISAMATPENTTVQTAAEPADPAAVVARPLVESAKPLARVATESRSAAKPLAPPAVLAESTAPAATPEARSGADKRQAAPAGEVGSIRVAIDKIDALINMVGELVITQSMLNQLGSEFEMSRLAQLQEGLAQLERNTRELQESVMGIRMLPISFAFNRFPRMVHDLSQRLNKKVELKLSGEQTELDKTVMERIGDPLIHLVRNSIDHGIELPEKRLAAGKPETGTVHLNAYHRGGNIVIEISDDGAGLNRERIYAKAVERGLINKEEIIPDDRVLELIFLPGFSTAEQVSDVSGRGVGMDVVRRNIKELGGTVELKSEVGKGTTFTIRLPLTLAILDGQLVRVGGETYIVPLVSIVESLQIRAEHVNAVAGRAEVYKLRDAYLPIVRLYDLFGQVPDNSNLDGGLLVVVEGDGQRVGLFVDDLLNQQQVVIKSLETNFRRVPGLSGATILGDGRVALILDVAGLIQCARATARNGVRAGNLGARHAAA
jgi:two-component system chemotaxis sensor kinase CheA